MSFMYRCSVREARRNGSPIITSENPMMALSGVRTSWLIRASRSALVRFATAIGQPACCCGSPRLFGSAKKLAKHAKKFGRRAGFVQVIDSGMMRPLRTRAQYVAAIIERLATAAPLMPLR